MLKLKCKKHPQYAGKQSPRAACSACIDLWNIRQKVEMWRVITIVEPHPKEKPFIEETKHDEDKGARRRNSSKWPASL